jgi:hypothetical protein
MTNFFSASCSAHLHLKMSNIVSFHTGKLMVDSIFWLCFGKYMSPDKHLSPVIYNTSKNT